MRNLFLLVCLLSSQPLMSQDLYPKMMDVDIRQYIFTLSLSDSSDLIKGEAIVTADMLPGTGRLALDLVKKNGRYGMEVSGVREGPEEVPYTYEDDRIIITPGAANEMTRVFTISYRGIPERGLVIDTTKFGQRSFFGDNWPNLARHWLPSVDHPYDKAAVAFNITAPEHYDVLATGKKVEESNLGDGLKLTRYVEPAPVATKVMTIGVTRFASMVLGTIDGTEISAWVYPENRLEGFSDFAVAVRVMDYFTRNIGPYPYAKLANMQAKTQWGGLENAGTIAYRESSVNGRNEVEGLIAHEIAHQWFGNSATENSWNHVWLSEGFATYFTILYLENIYGQERRMEELRQDRREVIDYFKSKKSPVVDTTMTDPMKVLSTNSYQKGSWVLNMLRHKVGDKKFWEGMVEYYQTFENSNVLTSDLRNIMEEVSGITLEEFFNQWLYVMGHPVLDIRWKYKKNKVLVTVEQKQDQHIFRFPLELGLVISGEMRTERVEVMEKKQTFEFKADSAPDRVIPDPYVWLLFEEFR